MQNKIDSSGNSLKVSLSTDFAFILFQGSLEYNFSSVANKKPYFSGNCFIFVIFPCSKLNSFCEAKARKHTSTTLRIILSASSASQVKEPRGTWKYASVRLSASSSNLLLPDGVLAIRFMCSRLMNSSLLGSRIVRRRVRDLMSNFKRLTKDSRTRETFEQIYLFYEFVKCKNRRTIWRCRRSFRVRSFKISRCSPSCDSQPVEQRIGLPTVLLHQKAGSDNATTERRPGHAQCNRSRSHLRASLITSNRLC